MDPLTVLSLTANLIQLLHASLKTAKAFHKSGVLPENLQTAEITKYLRKCYETLHNSLDADNVPIPLRSTTELRSLSFNCLGLAHTLCNELEALKKCPGDGWQKAMAKLLRTTRKAKLISHLKIRLEDNQKALDTLIQADIRHMVRSLATEQHSQSQILVTKLNEIVTQLPSPQINATSAFVALIDETITTLRDRIESHISITLEASTSARVRVNELQKKKEQLRASLRFTEINLRQNEIADSFPNTFNWAFENGSYEEHNTLRWDSFRNWLEQGQGIYWISGKAGSGKSTLMKFLVADSRTNTALKFWAGNLNYLSKAIFFWLSGSKIQRSIKGFLCSFLTYLLEDDSLLEKILCKHGQLVECRRNVEDWSVIDLKSILDVSIGIITQEYKLCLFLDGIDELDEEEDNKGIILRWIQQICDSSRIKFCVSSRPELYIQKKLAECPKLHLQDLTREDMRICVEHDLATYSKEANVDLEKGELESLVRLVLGKADGVFLWVHFALKSVLRGMRNEDSFEILRERLEDLPSGMEELYQKMWQRLNGDVKSYKLEASEYFSYQKYFPLSVFEFAVAAHLELRQRYQTEMIGLDAQEVAKLCQTFMARVITRCAGLLEFHGPTLHCESCNYYPRRHSLPDRRHQSFHGKPCTSQSTPYPGLVLNVFLATKVSFIHRTAKDFLLNTEAGRRMLGEPQQSSDQLLENITTASLALLLQDLHRPSFIAVFPMFSRIKFSQPRNEVELVNRIRKVLENVKLRMDSSKTRNQTMYGHHFDTPGWAVEFRLSKYLHSFLNEEDEHVSLYYRGYLFCLAMMGQDYTCGDAEHDIIERLALGRWLVQHGADLETKQYIDSGHGKSYIKSPFETLLNYALDLLRNGTLNRQHLECLIHLLSESATVVLNMNEVCVTKLKFATRRRTALLYVEATVSSLYRLIMGAIHPAEAGCFSTRSMEICLEPSLKIIAFSSSFLLRGNREYDYDDIGLESQVWQPTADDAASLGCAIQEATSENGLRLLQRNLDEEFLKKLEEIKPRSSVVAKRDWKHSMGCGAWRQKESMILDPSVDVDQTNWWSRGWSLEALPVKKKFSYQVLPRPPLFLKHVNTQSAEDLAITHDPSTRRSFR